MDIRTIKVLENLSLNQYKYTRMNFLEKKIYEFLLLIVSCKQSGFSILCNVRLHKITNSCLTCGTILYTTVSTQFNSRHAWRIRSLHQHSVPKMVKQCNFKSSFLDNAPNCLVKAKLKFYFFIKGPPTSVIVPIYRRDCHMEVYAGTHR